MILDYQNYVLLISLSDPVEAFNIKNILDSGGIKVLEKSNVSGPYLSEIDGPLSQYDIYVEINNLSTARELLENIQAETPRRKSNKRVVRLIPLTISVIFFTLYLLTTSDTDIRSSFVLFALSLLFLMAFLLSFYKGNP